MKKVLFAIAVAVVAFVACEKTPDPEKGGELLTYTGPKEVIIEEGTNFYTVNFKAGTEWSAFLEENFQGVKSGAEELPVTMDKSEGGAGDQSIKLTFNDLEEDEDGRLLALTVTAGTEEFSIVFMQGKVFVVRSMGEGNILGPEGGKVTYKIYTSCKYEVKTYQGADQAFPWAPVSFDEKAGTFTFDVEKNSGYDKRNAYVKFTVAEIQIPVDGGGTADYVERAYVYQGGALSVAWNKTLSSFGSSMSTPGAYIRLGYADGKIIMSDGTNITSIDAQTGDKVESAACAAVSMDVDAAGHIVIVPTVIANETSQKVYWVKNGELSEICTIACNVYSSTGLSHFTVTGDITKDAVICGQTDLYNYCTYVEIKNGTAQEAVSFALPSQANFETWGGINWNSSRNGCVVARGTTADDGFLYTVYDGSYCLFDVKKDGTSSVVYDYEDKDGGSNINFQCIDVCNWKGVNYAVLGLTTYFSWGDCPNYVLVNLDTKEVVSKFDSDAFFIDKEYIGANDGENASADVVLIPGEDKLSVVLADVLSNVIYRADYPEIK